MKLTLFMPGLGWLDGHDGAEVCKGLALPALSLLLGRGQLTRQTCTLSERKASLLPAGDASPASRFAAQCELDPSTNWLLADPVHLRIDRDRALLADVGVMRLSQTEADQLLGSLNHHFAEDGLRFHAPRPDRWLLSLPTPAGAAFTPLQDAVGENVNQHLPRGEDGLRWSRLLNEMQMLLYTHPVNDERESRGELAVNSVWLWGQQAARSSLPIHGGWQTVLTDDDDAQQAALRGGLDADAAPYAYAGLAEAGLGSRNVLVEVDALLAAAQYRDAWGWREALQRLEADWFAPLLAALKRGEVSELTLTTHGSAGFTLSLTPAMLWRFWRRPLDLPALYTDLE